MTYSVVVSMDVDTVQALQAGGYLLYALRVVRCSNRAARPVVWSAIANYSANTAVTWSDAYQAYTSTTPIQVGQVLFIGFSAALSLGEVLQVRAGGVGMVQSGLPGFMSILNTTDASMTAGLAQDAGAALVPV